MNGIRQNRQNNYEPNRPFHVERPILAASPLSSGLSRAQPTAGASAFTCQTLIAVCTRDKPVEQASRPVIPVLPRAAAESW
jgi:hypothetical protein